MNRAKGALVLSITLTTLFGVVFVFANKLNSFQQKGVDQELINKVENLILQKDRALALDLLESALVEFKLNESSTKNIQKKESVTKTYDKKQNGAGELTKKARAISRIFLSERAQQSYELSLSTKIDDPKGSFNHLQGAKSIEPDNLAIQLEYIRILLSRKDCKGAIEEARKIKSILNSDEEVQLAYAALKLCYMEEDKPLPSDLMKFEFDEPANPVWKIIWYSYGLSKKINGIKQLTSNKDFEKLNYPEVIYWEYKSKKPRDLTMREAYLKRCKEVTSKEVRVYLADAFFCSRIKEVENEK